MRESYAVMFWIDYEQDEARLVVTEKDQNGNQQIVNVLGDINEIGELYERLTGRELY